MPTAGSPGGVELDLRLLGGPVQDPLHVAPLALGVVDRGHPARRAEPPWVPRHDVVASAAQRGDVDRAEDAHGVGLGVTRQAPARTHQDRGRRIGVGRVGVREPVDPDRGLVERGDDQVARDARHCLGHDGLGLGDVALRWGPARCRLGRRGRLRRDRSVRRAAAVGAAAHRDEGGNDQQAQPATQHGEGHGTSGTTERDDRRRGTRQDAAMSSTLFEPATLGPLTLRNRIIKAATFEGRTPDGAVTPELVEFHRRIAAGGAAMTTVAYLAVAPEGRTDSGAMWLHPEVVDGLRTLTDAVHDQGALAAAQIGHAGPVAERGLQRRARLRAGPAVQPARHAPHQGGDRAPTSNASPRSSRAALDCASRRASTRSRSTWATTTC